MQRRHFMSQVTAAVAGAGAVGLSQANATDERDDGRHDKRDKPTFVLVHGAWHGGWCWSEVVRLLGERGYPAIALDLPGHGITARFPQSYVKKPQDVASLHTEVSPLAALSLDDYRAYVVHVIRGLIEGGSGRVILVGHSLGGATLSAVGEAIPRLIRRLVYLTAFVPGIRFPNTLSYILDPSFAGSEVPPLAFADPAAVGALRINHDSADAAYAAADKHAFYADVADLPFQAVANLLTLDEPIQAFTTNLTPTKRWGRIPRAFIRCTEDRAIPITVQDQMIADADAFTPHNVFEQRTLQTSHSPFVSAPAALVAKLLSL